MASVSDVVVCGGCKNPIGNEQWLRCCLCAQLYDLLCASASEATYNSMTTELKDTWICLECKCKQPRRDNSNTPVRSTGLGAGSNQFGHFTDARENSNIYSVLQKSQFPCDEQNMNVTVRKTQSSQNRKSTEQLYDEYLHPDETYLDNLRVVIQEEFHQVINERLTNVISNAVAKQVTLIVNKCFSKLNDQIVNLEKQLMLMTSRSVCSSAKCEQRQLDASNGNNLRDCQNRMQEQTAVQENIVKPRTAPSLDKKIVTAPIPSLGKSTSNPPKVPAKATLLAVAPLDQQDEIARESTNLDSSAVRVQDCHENSDRCHGEWVEVTKKRHNKSPNAIVRGSATPGLTQLEAAERVRYLHLYYVKIGTSEEQVRDHLKSILDSEGYTVEGLKARGNYASFKLGVPSRLENCVMDSENWPENVCIKPWRQNFRNKSTKPFQEQKTN